MQEGRPFESNIMSAQIYTYTFANRFCVLTVYFFITKSMMSAHSVMQHIASKHLLSFE